MNVYDIRTAPDYTTLTIDWETFWRAYPDQSNRERPVNVSADLIWELFSGNDGNYHQNNVERTGPLPYYPTAYTVPLMGFTVGFGSPKQGIIVQLSGAWWNLVHSEERLREALQDGWKCTRWDEALTMLVLAPNRRPADNIAAHYRALEVATHGNDLRWHHPRMKPGEETWYCGSRKSGQFARVYDKPELDYRNLQVVRVEMEYKRQWAPSMMEAWLDTHYVDLRVMSAFLMGECKGDDHPSIAFATKDSPTHPMPKPLPQPLADRPKWFYDQIQKAWMNWAEEDARAALLWLYQMRENVAPCWDDVGEGEFERLVVIAKENLGK